MPEYTYAIEILNPVGKWCKISHRMEQPLGWCQGWMAARQTVPGPTFATRLVRSDGLVVDEQQARAKRVAPADLVGVVTEPVNYSPVEAELSEACHRYLRAARVPGSGGPEGNPEAMAELDAANDALTYGERIACSFVLVPMPNEHAPPKTWIRRWGKDGHFTAERQPPGGASALTLIIQEVEGPMVGVSLTSAEALGLSRWIQSGAAVAPNEHETDVTDPGSTDAKER